MQESLSTVEQVVAANPRATSLDMLALLHVAWHFHGRVVWEITLVDATQYFLAIGSPSAWE